MRFFAICLILVLSFSALGCSGNNNTPREYDIAGTVTEIADDKSTVRIKHEAIPGLMKAMEMKIRLANPDIVNDIKPGDAVKGRLSAERGFTIQSLVKTAPR